MKHKSWICSIAAGYLLVFGGLSAHGSEVIKSAALAIDNIQMGNLTQAALELKKSINTLWKELPLTVHNVRLVNDLDGFSDRSSNVFAAGESIYLTCQLFGYNIKETGGGFGIDVAADFSLLTTGDVILGGQKNVMRFQRAAPVMVTDLYMNLTYRVTGVTPGTYIIQTTIRDQNSQKSVTFDQKVVFQ